jgi:lipopolysaccharide transport system permease protein
MSLSESTLDMEPSLPATAAEETLIAAPLPAGDGAIGHHEPLLTVIQARPGWQIVDFGEIWRFRELLYFLIWRDVKVRYKQTVLGAAWAVLQPTAQMVVFSIFFGRMAEVATDGIPYPLFAFAGLLPWMFFQNSVTSASQSVVGNQNLITKVYFPRLFIPASAIGAALVDFAIACGMLLALMAWYGTAPTVAILLAPLLALGLTAAAFGVGALLSALTVAYRDFRYVVPWMVQLWMFATPTVYMDASVTGPRWQLVLPLNPAYGLIHNFRCVTLGRPLDWYALGVSLTVTALFVVLGCLYFRKVERTFADII